MTWFERFMACKPSEILTKLALAGLAIPIGTLYQWRSKGAYPRKYETIIRRAIELCEAEKETK